MGLLLLLLLLLLLALLVDEQEDEEEDEGTSVAAGRVLNRNPVDMPINDETGE